MNKPVFRLALILILLTSSGLVNAGQSDITFLVAGKTSNHRQAPGGSIDLLNYHFFAEIFLQPNGRVTAASLVTPNRPDLPLVFEDGGYALELHGGRYQTLQELEAAYPDGSYVFRYSSPGTGEVTQSVALANTAGDGSALPAPPRIQLSQGGSPVSPEHIDPDQDLQVSWSDFSAGGADPLQIMDDLLFVIMGDCTGVRRAHSGRPYEGTPYLTYTDTAFTIAADKLLPENVYQLSVEHAVLDTSIEHEVVAFATFASTTFLDIRTTGNAPAGEACHAVGKRFDAGQTDR